MMLISSVKHPHSPSIIIDPARSLTQRKNRPKVSQIKSNPIKSHQIKSYQINSPHLKIISKSPHLKPNPNNPTPQLHRPTSPYQLTPHTHQCTPRQPIPAHTKPVRSQPVSFRYKKTKTKTLRREVYLYSFIYEMR